MSPHDLSYTQGESPEPELYTGKVPQTSAAHREASSNMISHNPVVSRAQKGSVQHDRVWSSQLDPILRTPVSAPGWQCLSDCSFIPWPTHPPEDQGPGPKRFRTSVVQIQDPGSIDLYPDHMDPGPGFADPGLIDPGPGRHGSRTWVMQNQDLGSVDLRPVPQI